MAAKPELARLRRSVITQAQLEEVVELRALVRQWRKKPGEMDKETAKEIIDQATVDLREHERLLRAALAEGAVIEAGELDAAVVEQ